MAEYTYCPGCKEHKRLEAGRVICKDPYEMYTCLDCGTTFDPDRWG